MVNRYWNAEIVEDSAVMRASALAQISVALPNAISVRSVQRQHDQPADHPYYVWSGTCRGNWAVTLRDEHAWADLTGPAKIRWRTKQSGFRELHIILKLSNGTWLVSDQADGESLDWRVWERNVANLRWRRLDIGAIVEGAKVERPDLSRVDEIGWTDLMSGGGSAACSRLDWIEVYAKHVARPTRLPQAKETR